MHMQPVFAKYESIGGTVAEQIFANGLCLSSGSNLGEDDLTRIINIIQEQKLG